MRPFALRLLVGLVSVGLPCTARATCQADGLLLFPRPGAVVPTNSQFILEGLGRAQADVTALVGKTLTFTSGEEQVSVKVQRGWSSSQARVAVVLRPLTPLLPERTYTWWVDRPLPGLALLNASAEGVVRWRTGKGPDVTAPKWVKKPATSGGEYTVDGDQIRRFIRFSLSLNEESPAYLVVTLRRARGPVHAQTYVVPVQGTLAWVGHDGCSGGFSYEDGRAYRARIEGFDAAGNPAPKLPVVEFQAPRQEMP